MNETLGIASTYACYNECMDSYGSGWVEPDWESIFPENSILLTAYQVDINSYQQPMPPYPVFSANWESGNPSAVSVNPSGEAYGVSGGVATITASWWADLPTGGETCQYYSALIEKEAFVSVAADTPTANISPIESIQVGTTAQISVEIEGGDGLQFSAVLWQNGDFASSVEFDGGGSSKIFSGSGIHNFTIKGIAASHDLNDTSVRVRYSGNTLDEEPFTSIGVEFLKDADCAGFDSISGQSYLMVPKSGNNMVKAKILPNGASGSFSLQGQSGSGISASPNSITTGEQTITVTAGSNVGQFTLDAIANQATQPAAVLNTVVRNRIEKTVIIHPVAEENDDFQASATETSGNPGDACVRAGNNGFRDTVPSGDDQIAIDPTTGFEYINFGSNGVCQTTANNTNIPAPSSHMPSASALQAALNNTYWGKQSNVYFTVSSGSPKTVNFDFDRDVQFSNVKTIRLLDYLAIEGAVRDTDYDINLYYTGLSFQNDFANAEAIPDAESVFFSPNHIGTVTYLASHEIGHILMPNASAGTVHSSNILDLMYAIDIASSPCRIRKREWDLMISQ